LILYRNQSYILDSCCILIQLQKNKRKDSCRPKPVPSLYPTTFEVIPHLSFYMIIMRCSDYKSFSSIDAFISKTQMRYRNEADTFQHRYNEKNKIHIWRHMLYSRIFHFYINGDLISVPVEIIRFIFAGSNKTFSFYGSLLLPRTTYSVPLLKNWINSKPAFLSPEVCNRWYSAVTNNDDTLHFSPNISDYINEHLLDKSILPHTFLCS